MSLCPSAEHGSIRAACVHERCRSSDAADVFAEILLVVFLISSFISGCFGELTVKITLIHPALGRAAAPQFFPFKAVLSDWLPLMNIWAELSLCGVMNNLKCGPDDLPKTFKITFMGGNA